MYKEYVRYNESDTKKIQSLEEKGTELFYWMIERFEPLEEIVLLTVEDIPIYNSAVNEIRTDFMTLSLSPKFSKILLSKKWEYDYNRCIFYVFKQGRVSKHKRDKIKDIFIEMCGIDVPSYRLDVIQDIIDVNQTISLETAIERIKNSNIFWEPEQITVRIHGVISSPKTTIEGVGIRKHLIAQRIVEVFYFDDIESLFCWKSNWDESTCLSIHSPNYGINIVIEVFADFNTVFSCFSKTHLKELRDDYECEFHKQASTKGINIIWN